MLRIKNSKLGTLIIVTVFASALVLGTSISSIGEAFAKKKYDDWDDCREDHTKNWCKKYFKKHGNNDKDDDNGGNSASQSIGQSQSSSQNSQVVSGGNTQNSGNNFNFQNQVNSGNNALAQQ